MAGEHQISTAIRGRGAPGNTTARNPALSRRRPRACDGCWQRKIRCDGGDGRCRNCQIYDIQCTVTRSGGAVILRNETSNNDSDVPALNTPSQFLRKRPRTSDAASRDGTQEPRSSVPASHVIPSAASNVRNAVAYANVAGPQHNNNRHPNNPNHAYTPGRFVDTDSPLPTPRSRTDDVLEGALTIENNMGNTRVSQKFKYAGRNSTQMMALSAQDMFQNDAIRINVMKFYCPLMKLSEEVSLPKPHLSPLIDKAVAAKYVDAFFMTINSMLPFIPESQFKEAFDDFYDKGQFSDTATVACIYLVIALGSRSVASPEDDFPHFHAAWALYDRIVASPYLTSVQAFILMTLELMSNNKDGQAVLAIGNAIRIAQSLGLHRALGSHRHQHERNFVGKDYQLRRYVWWVCYCLDKKIFFEIGRPSIINDNDTDVDTISYDEEPQESNPVGLRNQKANNKDAMFFTHFLGFCRILSQISTLLYTKKLEPIDEAAHIRQVEAIDMVLLEWKTKLPPELQFDAELVGTHGGSSAGCLLLHCMYYNSLLTVHKAALFGAHAPEIKNHPNPRIASSEVVCWNAARSLAGTVNDLINIKHNWPVLGWTTCYILTVVITLYTGIIRNPSSWRCDSDIVLIKSMAHCFARSNPNSVAISSFKELLNSFCAAINVARGQRNENDDLIASAANDPSAENHQEQELNSELTQQNQTEEQDHSQHIYDNSYYAPAFQRIRDTTSGHLDGLSPLSVENIFGFGDMDAASITQLWPVDLDPMDPEAFPMQLSHGAKYHG